jgi:hypothetical protein
MIPREIRERLLDPCRVGSIMALAPGMSGAKLFRCEGDQTWVLRCWPQGTAPDRVREIHFVIGSASIACPLIPKYRNLPSSTVPHDKQTFVIDSAGLIWELSDWMPGQPLPYDAPMRHIRVGARAIAGVHQAMLQAGVWRQPSRAVVQRLERMQWMNQNLNRCLVSDLAGRVDPAVEYQVSAAQKRLRRGWPKAARRIAETLEPFRCRSLSQNHVLRDVHREHVLFERGVVSGIIDFDAVRVDTPAVDLARWVTSFSEYNKNPTGAIDSILAGYGDDSTFPTRTPSAGEQHAGSTAAALERAIADAGKAEFRTLIEALAESSLWLSLANWVVWIVGESIQFDDFQRVAKRLARLVESVDATPNR